MKAALCELARDAKQSSRAIAARHGLDPADLHRAADTVPHLLEWRRKNPVARSSVMRLAKPRTCSECQKPVGRGAQWNRRYCSAPCRERAKLARKRREAA